jgi:hypothetical protein
MTSFAGSAAWTAEAPSGGAVRPIPRGWEIAGIVLGFVFAWPAALAYLVWKCAGYPLPDQARAVLERRTGFSFAPRRRAYQAYGYRHSGNSAFEEYRQRELARLEEERRRLDEESRAFAVFVEELKRAKDREEFDAFMAKRRAAGQAS